MNPQPESPPEALEEPRARVVYTQAPVVLGTVLERDGERCRVRVGARELELAIHGNVDPALLDDAAKSGALVLIDQSAEPSVVGVVQTTRALTIDREGNVEAKLKRLTIDVSDAALVRSPKAFLHIERAQVEIYGERVLTRAREVAKVLARLISLN